MVIYVHIARAAGSLVREYIRKYISNIRIKYHKSKEYGYENTQVYNFLCGHISYGIHTSFINVENFDYVTFLREPVDRWISFFHKEAKDRKGWFYSDIFTMKFHRNISALLEYCIENEVHSNMMVKQISGAENDDDIIKGKNFRSYILAPRKRKYSDVEMSSFLSKAKENLEKNFGFFGFVESFDKDFEDLTKYLKIPYFSVEKTNHADSELIQWENKSVQNLLFNLNRYDIELYNFAQELKQSKK